MGDSGKTRAQALDDAGVDEDEVETVVSGGGAHVLRTGLMRAEHVARSAYVSGGIDVDEFEHEIERLLRKQQGQR